MKTIRTISLMTLMLAGFAGLGCAAAEERPRAVVIELFTSQGCSSCPPADEVLKEMAKRNDVIALSLPVDYWDYLGWKDTLALHGHTERQYAYAKAHGESMVYTPQMVINGALALTGNSKDKVEEAIAHVRANAPLQGDVRISRQERDITVSLNGLPEGQYIVWLVPLSFEEEVEIGRGENAGRSISYVNVPLTWIKLGTVSGGAQDLDYTADAEAFAEADGCAVLM